jgi:hypothetical protein
MLELIRLLMLITCPDKFLNLPTTVLSIRGGKSPKSSSRKSSSKSSGPSKRKPVYDDEEDDDDFEEDNRRSRKKGKQGSKAASKPYKSGRSSKSSKSGGMNLIPWGSGGGKKSKGFALPLPALGDFKDKLQDLAKQGQSAYKDVYRRAKVKLTVIEDEPLHSNALHCAALSCTAHCTQQRSPCLYPSYHFRDSPSQI